LSSRGMIRMSRPAITDMMGEMWATVSVIWKASAAALGGRFRIEAACYRLRRFHDRITLTASTSSGGLEKCRKLPRRNHGCFGNDAARHELAGDCSPVETARAHRDRVAQQPDANCPEPASGAPGMQAPSGLPRPDGAFAFFFRHSGARLLLGANPE
jgi:hypothetical protein